MKWHDICCVAFSVHAVPQHGFGPSVRGGIILAKSIEIEPSIFINCRQWCRLLASCTVCQMNAITPSVFAGRFWIQVNQYSSCLADGTLHILSGWSRRQDGHDDLGRRHRVHSLQLGLHRRVVPELLRATAHHGRFSLHETAAALLSMFATVVQP